MSRPAGGLWDNTLTFNGVELASTYNAIVVHKQILNAPARSYTRLNIPAKNGVRYIDEGTFGNVTQSYTFAFPENFYKNYLDLKEYLLSVSNYAWLTEHFAGRAAMDRWYMQARFVSIVPNADRKMDTGSAVVTFDRMPQRWDVDGNPTLKPANCYPIPEDFPGGIIPNDSYYDAYPVFRCVGSGTFTLAQNEVVLYRVTIANNSEQYIDIDSETMDCYCGDTNCNMYVSLGMGFPVLHPGDTEFNATSGLTVTIAPRWWTI